MYNITKEISLYSSLSLSLSLSSVGNCLPLHNIRIYVILVLADRALNGLFGLLSHLVTFALCSILPIDLFVIVSFAEL